MEDKLGMPERRNLGRLEMIYPVIYTRYDKKGRAWDQKISRLLNVSLGGVRLQSSFPVDPGEMLDITMALGDNLVSFKGKVIHVTPSEDEGFELGISIEEIEDRDRVALIRFLCWTQAQVR